MGNSIREVISYLESVAPPVYQESYDNAGLIVGNPQEEVKGILCSLDVTEEVVLDAVAKNCNLIVAHHPVIFKGIKSLTGKNYVERTIIRAIKEDVAIYAIHTNLDHVIAGVNKRISDKLGLIRTEILLPKKNVLMKLVTFIPTQHTEEVLHALYESGAGKIGNYEGCSFRVKGTGTFLPNENANPSMGSRGKMENVEENRVEIMFPSYQKAKVLKELKNSHPYEEVAYYLQELENENQEVGAGMVGELKESMQEEEFLQHLKKSMELKVIKHTSFKHKPIKKVALCGGAGIFLLPAAKRSGADIFITSDVKYHEFFDADNQIIITDIGHYESEIFTKELLLDHLSQKFSNIALYLTNVITNPISYL